MRGRFGCATMRVMRPSPQVTFLLVAVAVVVLVIFLPRPWGDLVSALVMAGVFAFSITQERRTGRSAGIVKWLALALAVWDAYRFVTFFVDR